MLIETIGGIGLFLLGMLIMTDALRSLAGLYLRSSLIRFTHTPLSGAVTGAITTAILQSSSATTIATVGFVSAGLLTYSQSLGIIFGANIGTTVTGWLVALIGFKLKLGTVMLAVLFTGVLLRLFSRGRLARLGMALAGFALIFVGIQMMQQGMSSLEQYISPDIFPTDTLGGRLKLVLIGIIITIITQSSSAGVATALTALYMGSINFEQAASLVIGMDVGTTFSAALATIGGSVNSRRTGFSHVIYNMMTGSFALLLLTPYTYLLYYLTASHTPQNPEIALVAFHTLFNVMGVLAILPFAQYFEKMIKSIFPDRSDSYTETLDPKLIGEPDIALNATQASIHSELLALVRHISSMLKNNKKGLVDLRVLQQSLDETHAYIDQIHLTDRESDSWKILISLIHSLDHMQRLHERAEEDYRRAAIATSTPLLEKHLSSILAAMSEIIPSIEDFEWEVAEQHARNFSRQISREANKIRHEVMTLIAMGEISVSEGTNQLEAIRWLRRVGIHIFKILHYQHNITQILHR